MQDFVEPHKFGGEHPQVSSGRAANARASAAMNASHARLLLQICATPQTHLRNDVSMLIHSKKRDGGCSSRPTSVEPTALAVIIAIRRRRDECYAAKVRTLHVRAAM